MRGAKSYKEFATGAMGGIATKHIGADHLRRLVQSYENGHRQRTNQTDGRKVI